MKQLNAKIILSIFFVGCVASQPSDYRYIDNAENVSHLQQSVVAIVSENEMGGLEGPECTAFYVTPRRLATALHCVEDRNTTSIQIVPDLILQISEDQKAEPTLGREVLFVDWDEHHRFIRSGNLENDPIPTHSIVIAVDHESDIAILELDVSEPSSEHWLPVSSNVTVGEKAYAIGMPERQFWILSDGIVSAIRIFPSGNSRILHHNLIAPGSSGSPLINNFGEVIGTTVQYVRTIPNLGVASTGEALQILLASGPQHSLQMSSGEVLNIMPNLMCEPDGSSCPMPESGE